MVAELFSPSPLYFMSLDPCTQKISARTRIFYPAARFEEPLVSLIQNFPILPGYLVSGRRVNSNLLNPRVKQSDWSSIGPVQLIQLNGDVVFTVACQDSQDNRIK